MQVARISNLEVLAQAKCGGGLWSLATTDKLAMVLGAGYFTARFASYGLRPHDRIMVTSSLNEPEAEYAMLIVKSIDQGEPRVELMNGSAL